MTPDAQVAAQADAARLACGAVGTYSAEIAVSGKVGGNRVRARLLAGFADGGRVRLEALAPFGQPVFILVTAGGRGTVVLPRDRKVVQDVPAADLLAALTGIAVDGADLAALLSGCVIRDGAATDGRQLPNGWASATLGGGRATAFLRAVAPGGPPKVVAGQLVTGWGVGGRRHGRPTTGSPRMGCRAWFGSSEIPRETRSRWTCRCPNSTPPRRWTSRRSA